MTPLQASPATSPEEARTPRSYATPHKIKGVLSDRGK